MTTNIPTPNMVPAKKSIPAAYRNKPRSVNPNDALKPKFIAPRKIRSCHHVPLGAVWCQNCADSNLSYWRKMVEKAKNSNFYVREEVKRKITEALEEYSLTKDGLRALEQAYVQLAASDPDKSLEAHTTWMNRVRKASLRNTEARRNSKGLRTLNNINQYGKPPKNKYGHFDTKELKGLTLTKHAKQRMELRNISQEQIENALRDFRSIDPHGQGKWAVIGNNDIVVCGFFEIREQKSYFIIKTTYKVGTEDIS